MKFNNYRITYDEHGEKSIIVKALSLKQPWANMIADRRKSIETRTWKTNYVGDILICSSLKPKIEPFGCALAFIDILGCRPMTKEDEDFACCEIYPRAQAWILGTNLRPIRPIPIKGALGIFELELHPSQIWFKPTGGVQFDDIQFVLPPTPPGT